MCREPKRCLKCQVLGTNHLAATCGCANTCGTCGKEHHTSECTEVDSDKYWCANCKVNRHASWDRLCPAFREASKWIECTDPEHTYRYFLGQEPWTWEQVTPSQGPNTGGWRNASMVSPQDAANMDIGGMWADDQPLPSSRNAVPSGEHTMQQPTAPIIQSAVPPPRAPRASTRGTGFQAGPSNQGWPQRPS